MRPPRPSSCCRLAHGRDTPASADIRRNVCAQGHHNHRCALLADHARWGHEIARSRFRESRQRSRPVSASAEHSTSPMRSRAMTPAMDGRNRSGNDSRSRATDNAQRSRRAVGLRWLACSQWRAIRGGGCPGSRPELSACAELSNCASAPRRSELVRAASRSSREPGCSTRAAGNSTGRTIDALFSSTPWVMNCCRNRRLGERTPPHSAAT